MSDISYRFNRFDCETRLHHHDRVIENAATLGASSRGTTAINNRRVTMVKTMIAEGLLGMRGAEGLRVAITGAAGFIGRAVLERVERGALGAIAELRLNDVRSFEHPNAEFVLGSCADAGVRDRLLSGGVDILFHLASLPGGAAERQPALGKTVNLDGSMALLDAAAGPGAPVVVYASSIAALGSPKLPVNDATALRPGGSYGTHKAMIELYLADLTRRGALDGRSVRPAGIVARPLDACAGFATAWMSELFHAALAERHVVIPVRAAAHIWLQSVDTVADNIVHAASMSASQLSPPRAWTLPATVARVDTLIGALQRRTGRSLSVEYGEGAMDHPPLDASSALAMGFRSDGDAGSLVDAVVARLERETARVAG